MTSDPNIRIDVFYGRIELKQDYRWEGDKLVCYGWSINYDGDGNERSRTEPARLSSIDFTGCDADTRKLCAALTMQRAK